MEKILTILILIGFNCFSQLDTTFNKYDSLLMNEINILRKSFGLQKLTPSLKIRINVTNVHAQYLKDFKSTNKNNWAHHPGIINTNENLRYSDFEIGNNSFDKSMEYGNLSVLYVIDMFYQSGKIKRSKDFFDSFYYWITKPDTINSVRNRKLDKYKYEIFKSFVYDKNKNFWLDDFTFKFTVNTLTSTYEDFLKEKDGSKKDSDIYYIKKTQIGNEINYLVNGTDMYVQTYLGMKELFVDKMGLDISYLFNKENLDYFRWETKSTLYSWYTSEGHKDILLMKYMCNSCGLAKNISVIRTTNYLGYLIVLLNIQNDDIDLVIKKEEEYKKIINKHNRQ